MKFFMIFCMLLSRDIATWIVNLFQQLFFNDVHKITFLDYFLKFLKILPASLYFFVSSDVAYNG